MMIDTHCHLDEETDEHIEYVINKMKDNYIIVSGYNDIANKKVIELVNKYSNVFGTIGIHPENIDDSIEENLKYIEDNLINPKIVGIGEIGLDYHYSKDFVDLQKEYFIKQIELAKKYDKTIVIHSRDAIEDTYEILDKYLGDNKAVLHCYGSSPEMAKKFLKFNMMFGIGGVVTFKNGQKMKSVVKEISIDNLLLETDSPYLSPEPFRGHKNEPYNIIYVAKEIANIKNISEEDVLKTTSINAKKQFDLTI